MYVNISMYVYTYIYIYMYTYKYVVYMITYRLRHIYRSSLTTYVQWLPAPPSSRRSVLAMGCSMNSMWSKPQSMAYDAHIISFHKIISYHIII